MALKRRVVVVGLGSIGRRHARLLLERRDVQVEVLETRPEAIAIIRKELGDLQAHQSFDSMLLSQPDVVWIATPPALHEEQATAALSRGVHVFCEKPMTDSVASALRMEHAARAAPGIFNVGFYLHFWPGFQAIRDLVRQGRLGTLMHLHSWIGTYVTLVNSASHYQATSPGSLFFDYSHQPDLFYWMIEKPPQTVWATGFRGGGLELKSEPNIAAVVCEYEHDLLATIILNYVQVPDRHYYEFVGDEAWVALDFNLRTLQIGSRKTQQVEITSYPMERDDIFRAEQQAFFDAIDGKREPETTAAAASVSTAVCTAALESLSSQARVPIRMETWGKLPVSQEGSIQSSTPGS